MTEPNPFSSYTEMRQLIEATTRARNEQTENIFRNSLVDKISVILNRMAAQEKMADFVEYPTAGALSDPKDADRRNKVISGLHKALTDQGWIIADSTSKGFEIRRK